MILILTNLVMLGIEVDVSSTLSANAAGQRLRQPAASAQDDDPLIFQVLNLMIVAVFIFEPRRRFRAVRPAHPRRS